MSIWSSPSCPVARLSIKVLPAAASFVLLFAASEAIGAAPRTSVSPPAAGATTPIPASSAVTPPGPTAPVSPAPKAQAAAAPVATGTAPNAPAAAGAVASGNGAPPQPANSPASGAAPPPAARVVTSATDGVAVVPPANFGEKRAAALANEAMNKDYLAMTYPNAEKKLRRALQICTEQKCSPAFNARLHRDVGIIYVVGLNRREDGKKEFTTALTLDPTVAISAETNTDETDKAFLEVKYAMFPETKPPATAAPTSSAGELGALELEPKKTDSSDGGAWRQLTNWVSLSIQQDLFFHSPTKYVCNHSSYRCIDASGVPQDFTTRTVTAGNEIPSTKLKAGTLRLLLGYERLLLKNVSVGLKLGMVISGKAPRVPSDSAVVLVHGEARVSYFFGSAPFEPTNVIRPYALAALGISEASSKVGVDIYEPSTYQRVAAWKRSSKFFVGVGGGAVFNLWKNHGPFVEGRLNMTGNAGIVAALQAGYTYGF